MPRTTDAEVKRLIEVDTALDLTVFIETSNDLVTEVCVTKVASAGKTAYSDTRLRLIEAWLAAHFYAIRDRDHRASSESAGGVSQSFTDKTGMHLEQTIYGQQAMVLDTHGGLSDLNASMGASSSVPKVLWIGKKPKDQKAWEDEDVE